MMQAADLREDNILWKVAVGDEAVDMACTRFG
jgi:hypothetical protein